MGKKSEIISLQVGKNGLTESVINEVKTILKKYKLVKLKFLRSFIDNNNFNESIDKLIKDTDSKLEKKAGFTIILKK